SNAAPDRPSEAETSTETARSGPQAMAELDWPMHTDRLTLRPTTAADAELTWRYHRLETVAQWLSYRSSTIEEHRTRFAGDAAAEILVVELDGIVIGDVKVRIGSPWAQAEVRDRADRTEAELGWVF